MLRTGPTVVSIDGLPGKIDGIFEVVVFGGITVRGTLLGIPLADELVEGMARRDGTEGIVWIVRTGPALVPEGGRTVRGMLEGTPPPVVRMTGLSSRGMSEGMPLRGMVGTTGAEPVDERMIRGVLEGMPLALGRRFVLGRIWVRGTVGAMGRLLVECGSGRTLPRGGVLKGEPTPRLEVRLPSAWRM